MEEEEDNWKQLLASIYMHRRPGACMYIHTQRKRWGMEEREYTLAALIMGRCKVDWSQQT